MDFANRNINFFIVVGHFVLGMLMLSAIISKSVGIVVVFVGFLSLLATKNKNNEAMLWSAYVVGSEVLLRMSGGLFFHETSKYLVFVFLMTGMIVEKRKHGISQVYILYILLLLVGIAFSQIPYPESIRKNIIFNLSGPILLGVSAMYFYRRKIAIDQLMNMLFYMTLPLISMLGYLFFKSPQTANISFTANSNYAAAGGFGPNQVSTILSLGIFTIMVHLYYRKRISGYFLIDVLLLAYLTYRVLLTLSRGGMFTVLIALVLFTFFHLLSKKNGLLLFFKYAWMVVVGGLLIWFYTSGQTGGQLDNRYANKNTIGVEKSDLSTGRFQLLETEIEGFFENPFFGMGVGSGKFVRLEKTRKYAASHNEMSRLLGEHGAVGIIILFLLIVVPLANMNSQKMSHMAFLSAFLAIWFFTINHSAMRLAMPAFIYGLTVMVISKSRLARIDGETSTLDNEENSPA